MAEGWTWGETNAEQKKEKETSKKGQRQDREIGDADEDSRRREIAKIQER